MENNASVNEAKTVIAIDCLAAMRSKRRSLWNCQGEGVRGHSPSRLTCTSAPTFCLDCCVFQRMLECDSGQSVVWWIWSCSGRHFMPQHRYIFSCFGFFCWLGLVFSTVWCGHHCVHPDRRTRTCEVTTSTPVRLAEKSAVSLFLYTTRAMNCCQLEKKRKNMKQNDC